MAKKIKEEVKFTLSEIKKNIQETNSEGKEARIQINNLEHKEEINTQPEQNGETGFKKKNQGENKKTLGHLQKCQHPNHRDARKKRRKASN